MSPWASLAGDALYGLEDVERPLLLAAAAPDVVEELGQGGVERARPGEGLGVGHFHGLEGQLAVRRLQCRERPVRPQPRPVRPTRPERGLPDDDGAVEPDEVALELRGAVERLEQFRPELGCAKPFYTALNRSKLT